MATTEIKSEITGNVWKIVVKIGDRVTEDDTLMILESMKMEIPLTASEDGVVEQILVNEAEVVAEGQVVVILST